MLPPLQNDKKYKVNDKVRIIGADNTYSKQIYTVLAINELLNSIGSHGYRLTDHNNILWFDHELAAVSKLELMIYQLQA